MAFKDSPRRAAAAPTRRGVICTLAFALVVPSACGSDGPAAPTEMSVESTQAALTASQVASGVGPTLQAAIAFVKGLPNDLKAALSDQQQQQIIATLKDLIGGVTGCVAVTKLTARSYKIDYDSCVFGVAPRSVTVSGALTLTLTIQPLKASGTITAKLEQLSIDGAVFDGSVSATLSLVKGKGAIRTVIDVSRVESGETSTWKLDGSMALLVASQTATLKASGSVSGPQGNYAVTIDDLVVKVGDTAPSSGSITVELDSLSVKIVFSAATPTDGTFEVIFNGVSFGTMSVADLQALLAKLAARP